MKQVARAVELARTMVEEQGMLQRVAALATSSFPAQHQQSSTGLQQALQQVAQPHFNISSGHSAWPRVGMMEYGIKSTTDPGEPEEQEEEGV